MDTIFIIGNGFDMAHNLPTGYTSFLKHAIQSLSDGSKDVYPKIRRFINISFTGKPTNKDQMKKLFEGEIEKANSFSAIIKNRHSETIFDKGKSFSTAVNKVKINLSNSILLKEIANNPAKVNWVDFEEIYFQELLKIVSHNDLHPAEKEEKVGLLNQELAAIKDDLEHYLLKVSIEFSYDFLSDELDKIQRKEVENVGQFSYWLETLFRPKARFDHEISGGLIIDFNYTQTFKRMVDSEFVSNKMTHMKIHGELGMENLIFGYGHREDDYYNQIVDSNIPGALDGIKLFSYVQNRIGNRSVQAFFDQQFEQRSHFRVVVFGHSCGISDSNLLEKVLRHKSCQEIHICYHRPEAWLQVAASVRRRLESDEDFARLIQPRSEAFLIPRWETKA